GGLRTGIRRKDLGQLTIGSDVLHVTELYRGYRQEVNSDLHIGRLDIEGIGSWLRTIDPVESSFLRHKGQIKYRSRHFTVGYRDEHERNLFRSDSTAVLIAPSYAFHDCQVFVQSTYT